MTTCSVTNRSPRPRRFTFGHALALQPDDRARLGARPRRGCARCRRGSRSRRRAPSVACVIVMSSTVTGPGLAVRTPARAPRPRSPTYRSPAGPPATPAWPLPVTRSSMPSDTPAGMSTVTVPGVRAPALPDAALRTGRGSPGRCRRRSRTAPPSSRCRTRSAGRSGPRPRRRSVRQATGAVPGSAPLPMHRVARRPALDLQLPAHAEDRLAERQRDAHARGPRRAGPRDRGPRAPADAGNPPPKNMSKMSWMSAKPRALRSAGRRRTRRSAALLGIREDLVRARDLLEPLLGAVGRRSRRGGARARARR